MSTDSCIYCKKEFTHLTPEECLLGKFTDKHKESIQTYINMIVDHGFNYRCKCVESDKECRSYAIRCFQSVIRETVNEVMGTEAETKISNYCPHIADYTITKIISNSPGLLVLLARRTTIDFTDYDTATKHSLGLHLYINFTPEMFLVYASLGFNFSEELTYNNGNNKTFLLTDVIKKKRLFMAKFFLSVGAPVSQKDLILASDWPEISEDLRQIYVNDK